MSGIADLLPTLQWTIYNLCPFDDKKITLDQDSSFRILAPRETYLIISKGSVTGGNYGVLKPVFLVQEITLLLLGISSRLTAAAKSAFPLS